MKREDLFEAIGNIDDELVKRSEKTTKKYSIARLGSIAACFVLVVSIGVWYISNRQASNMATVATADTAVSLTGDTGANPDTAQDEIVEAETSDDTSLYAENENKIDSESPKSQSSASSSTADNDNLSDGISSDEDNIGELVEYRDGGIYMSIVIPQGWDYNIRTSENLQEEDGLVTCAIDFWNEDYPDDVFQLGYMPEKLGMCATGVTIEHYIMENGISGTSYIEKDDEKVWITITINTPKNVQSGTYFVSGSPNISDWDNIETEFYQILSTAWVGAR